MLKATGDLSMVHREPRGWLFGALVVIALAGSHSVSAAGVRERSGESVVREVCAFCHLQGKNGAPIIGDKKSWAKRKEQGLTSLTQHALDGIRGMPAHGGSAGISSNELERAIIYMVNRSGGDWIEAVDKDALPTARTGEQVVKAKCGDCHLTGRDGAPKIGDRDAWIGRVSKGLEKVIASGIHGRGAMPARGGMADLSDAEMRSAVIYMFAESTAPKGK